MNYENNYLRCLGVFKCKIKKVAPKPAKGKKGDRLSITLESEDGRLVDQDYETSKLKPTDDSKGGVWAKKQLREILEICGVKKPSELVGKEIAVLVAPSIWEGKVFWNPRSFYDVKYLLGEAGQLDQVLSSMDDLLNQDSSDSISF